jgi:glucokinase
MRERERGHSMVDVQFFGDAIASIAGINIGGTTTTVVGGQPDGSILSRWSTPTPARDGELLIRSVTEAVRFVAPKAERIGVAVGGPFDAERGIVTEAPHLPGLRNVPLRDRLAAELSAPVIVHHDAAACALAEWHWGPDAGRDLAYLTCGTGFGSGLILGGRVRYGAGGQSPEIGHVRYRNDGPRIFGKPGCFEGYGSASALALLAGWRAPERYRGATPLHVVNEAREGEPTARWALRENERAVGAACALLADLLGLDLIVLGTLAVYLGPSWIERVIAVFREEALASRAGECTIRAAMPDVQDRSALAAAIAVP